MIIEIPKQRNVTIFPQFAIVDKSSYHAARINVSRNAFLNSRSEARFKRRILHAPNRIAELNACKMRRLNQLYATHFNSMRVSRIFD